MYWAFPYHMPSSLVRICNSNPNLLYHRSVALDQGRLGGDIHKRLAAQSIGRLVPIKQLLDKGPSMGAVRVISSTVRLVLGPEPYPIVPAMLSVMNQSPRTKTCQMEGLRLSEAT